MRLYGIDGCPAGWVVAVSDVARRAPSFEITGDLAPFLDDPRSTVAIDIPIGLPSGIGDGGSRACDIAARRLLGRPRQSSVFPTPCRATVQMAGRLSEPLAKATNYAACGKRITRQAYALLEKIHQVDELVTPARQDWVREAHPEVILYDLVRLIARADEARPLLTTIPDDAVLEEGTDDQIDAAARLIELLAGAYQIGWGKATKVLHKKRPDFIPVLDAVAVDFLWKNFPHRLTGGSWAADALRLYRELLLARAAALEAIRAALAERGFALSTARLLDLSIWIGWRGCAFRPLRQVWDAASRTEARAKARLCWTGA